MTRLSVNTSLARLKNRIAFGFRCVWILLIVSSVWMATYAQNPGGVAGAGVWYKTDGMSAGPNVSAWTDQIAPINNSTFTSIDVINDRNFHPVASVDAVNDDIVFDRPFNNINSFSAFVVFGTNSTVGDKPGPSHWRAENSILSADVNGGTSDFGLTMGGGKIKWWSDNPSTQTLVASSAPGYNNSLLTIAGFTRSNVGTFPFTLHANGAQVASGTHVATNLNGNNTWALNWHPGSTNGSGGNSYARFAEVIVYNSALPLASVNAIETYLAVKYGITLTRDYTGLVAANLYTIAGYQNDVFGLGRLDASALHQKQARPAVTLEANNNIAIYHGSGFNGTFPATNSLNGNDLTDGQFLITGHNGGATTFSASYRGAPNTLMSRIYKITDNNAVGPVTLRFSNSTFASMVAGGYYYLAVSNDAVFDQADTYVPIVDAGGGVFYVEYDFDNNATQFFTIREGGEAGPGGITAGNTAWWKADAGTSGANLTTWTDQSPYARILTKSSGTVSVLDGYVNFNPSLDLTALARDFSTSGAFNGTTMAVVMRNIGTSNNDDGVAGFNSSGFRFNATNQIKEGGGADDFANGAGVLRRNATAVAANGNTAAVNSWSLLLGNHATTVNGIFNVGGFQHGTNQPNPAGMDVAEVVVYSQNHNTGAAQTRIESYLALKYGITLSTGIYESSNGTSIFNAGLYPNNIAGIGRDDRSALYQKQSSSVNGDSIITVGLGAIAATNAANPSVFPSDQSFFIWSDNAGDDCWSSVEVGVSGFSRRFWRTGREWKFTATGSIPSVLIRVDSIAGSWVLPPLPDSAATYQLLLDADGDFSAGAVPFGLSRTPGSASYEVTLASSDFSGYSFFTIGTLLPIRFNDYVSCNTDTIFFYGSNLDATCLQLDGPVTDFNLSPGPVVTNTNFVLVADNPVGCIDTAKWVNITAPSGAYGVNPRPIGCVGPISNTVSYDTVRISASVAAGTLEVNGSVEAFLCLGDPNATLTGYGGQLSSVLVYGSGNFSSLVDTTNFANDSLAILFVNSGNVGHHKVFLAAAGCSIADTVDVFIGIPGPSALNYTVSTACETDTVPLLPSVTPLLTRGTYFSTTSGLAVDINTGEIDPSSSNPGTYFVNFNPIDSTCLLNSVATVTINAVDRVIFDYPSIYCVNDTNILPVVTAPFPGAFSISPSVNVGIDSLTGEILFQPTTPIGTHWITFTPSNSCGVPSVDSVIFRTPPAISFTLDSAACDAQGTVQAGNLSPALFANAYTWSSPVPGAIVFASPGVIDLVGSSPGGPHPVQASYLDPVSGCTATAVEEIIVIDVLPVTVTYPSTVFCRGASNPLPVITSGIMGGTFGSTPSGLVFADSLSGQIDLTLSPAGIYQLNYTAPNPACPSAVPVGSITINPTPIADFDMPQAVCRSDSMIVMQLAEPGFALVTIYFGPFAVPGSTSLVVNDSTLSFSSSNGVLASDQTYQVRRIRSQGICRDTAYDYFYIHPIEDPTFEYLESEYCQSGSNPVPFIFGDGGGYFTSLNGAVVDPVTGLVDLDSSGADTFTVRYTTTGPCPDSTTRTFSIKPGYKSYFRYELSEACSRRDVLLLDTMFADPSDPQNFFIAAGTPPLQVNPATGVITGMNSLSFTGTVEYEIGHSTGTPGVTCMDTSYQTVSITTPDLSFNIEYGVGGGVVDTFCGIGTVVPQVFGNASGASLTNPAGLIYSNLGTFGEVDLRYSSHDQAFNVLMTNRSVCRDTAIDRFYIRSRDDARFSYGSNEACSGEGLLYPDTIHFTPGLFYYVPSFTGAVLDLNTTTGVINMANSTKNTSYRIYYRTLGNCRDTTNLLVDINASPEIIRLEATPGLSICVDDELELLCVGQGDVRWFVNGVTSGFNGPRFSSDDLQDGDTIRAILTEPTAGCSDTTERVVQVLVKPLAEIADRPGVVTESSEFTVNLRSLQDQTEVFWSVEGINVSLGIPNGQSDTMFVGDLYPVVNTVNLGSTLDPGFILFSLRPRTFGCVGETTVDTIFVTPEGIPVFIPEVITPNGDGHNDDWEIRYQTGIQASEYTIEVFNRAGAKVYTVVGLDERWNGGMNPDGVYWWILRDGAGVNQQQGGLTIRRR